jgi:hypothetical protein
MFLVLMIYFREYNAFNHKIGILTKIKVILIQNHELIEKFKNSFFFFLILLEFIEIHRKFLMKNLKATNSWCNCVNEIYIVSYYLRVQSSIVHQMDD